MSTTFTEADLERKFERLQQQNPPPANKKALLREMEGIFPGSPIDNRICAELEIPPSPRASNR